MKNNIIRLSGNKYNSIISQIALIIEGYAVNNTETGTW
jgi:hypothetical protein